MAGELPLEHLSGPMSRDDSAVLIAPFDSLRARFKSCFFKAAGFSGAGLSAWAQTALLAGLAAAIGMGLAGCHSGPHLTPQQAEGKHLYDDRCAHCHEYNDLALKKVPPNLHGVFTHKTLPSGAPATDVQVARTVLTGKGMMPSFAGRFTVKQMEALLAYLHTDMSGPHEP